jgi:hypothetical protein
MASKDKLVINVRHGQIGPAHDPYGTETLEVRRGTHAATMYSDGLGNNSMALKVDGNVTRSETWMDRGMSHDPNETKARLLFRRHVGVDPSQAIEDFEHSYRPDPMSRHFGINM